MQRHQLNSPPTPRFAYNTGRLSPPPRPMRTYNNLPYQAGPGVRVSAAALAGGEYPALGYVPTGTLTQLQAVIYNSALAQGATPEAAEAVAHNRGVQDQVKHALINYQQGLEGEGVGAAGGALTGLAIGAAAGELGGPIGAIVGAALGALIGGTVGLFAGGGGSSAPPRSGVGRSAARTERQAPASPRASIMSLSRKKS